MTTTQPVPRLIEQFERGLDAPICLTWELTYACNLACVHCLSSSGKRDPRELSTEQCKASCWALQLRSTQWLKAMGSLPSNRQLARAFHLAQRKTGGHLANT